MVQHRTSHPKGPGSDPTGDKFVSSFEVNESSFEVSIRDTILPKYLLTRCSIAVSLIMVGQVEEHCTLFEKDPHLNPVSEDFLSFNSSPSFQNQLKNCSMSMSKLWSQSSPRQSIYSAIDVKYGTGENPWRLSYLKNLLEVGTQA